MPTCIVLLRGVNVGGAAKVPMAQLRTALNDAGYADCRTYIQSGNIVLRGAPRTIATDVHDLIEREFGHDVKVVVRTVAQFEKLAKANPFVRRDADPSRQLHVGFLDAKPAKAAVDAIDPHRAAPDELRVSGTEVYFHCPDGWGNSKVSAGLEKALGVAMTVRNWRTVTTLLELAHA
jgi:uncharacterized protein (DUF1697 family)